MNTQTQQAMQRTNGQRQRTQLDRLSQLIISRQDKIEPLLPRHMDFHRFAKSVLSLITRQPKLLECSGESILLGIIQAAELGLDFAPVLGQAYLVPFFNKKQGFKEAKFIPGYRGLIKLAKQSGDYTNIEAHVIYSRDLFRERRGTERYLLHEPKLVPDEERGTVTGAYAIAWPREGQAQWDVMTLEDLERVRHGHSAAGNEGPWVTDTNEMYRKTVVKRLSKYLELSPQLAKAIDIDNRVESGEETADLAPPGMAEPPDAIDVPGNRGLVQRLTRRPVSEGQEFEPSAEAEPWSPDTDNMESQANVPMDAPPDVEAQVAQAEAKAAAGPDYGSVGSAGSAGPMPTPPTTPGKQPPMKENVRFLSEIWQIAQASGWKNKTKFAQVMRGWAQNLNVVGHEHQAPQAAVDQLTLGIVEKQGALAPQ